MGHRNARQSLEARIPEQLAGPFPQCLGGRAGHGVMPRVHVGQQGHVRGGEAEAKAVLGQARPSRQRALLAVLPPHQSGYLLT